MARLELITRYPSTKSRSLTLLFVHGSYTQAGIWDVNFLPYFADLGYTSHAVSLRGHGRSEGGALLPWLSMADYVEDLKETIDRIGDVGVLIGHSMGGMVVQHTLRSGKRPKGAVLMASVPPYGMWDASIGMLCRDPLLVHQLGMLMTFGPGIINIADVRRALFSDRVPAAVLTRYESLFQRESQRALIDLLAFDPFSRPPDTAVPVLVLGAANDAFLTRSQIDDTARFFGTSATIFPDMAHGMMIEPDWHVVADTIARWLEGIQAA
jgi:pimeloyl-ACP methyl ester carboxylesterase